MSLKDVLHLSKQTADLDHFGPVLVSVFESLIRDMAALCESNNVDISVLDAFSPGTSDWQTTLLQIYENCYM